MENKTFEDFVHQIATIYDPDTDEIRDVIATIILAAAHDSDLVNKGIGNWEVQQEKSSLKNHLERQRKALIDVQDNLRG